MIEAFSLLFAIALAATLSLKLWLGWRHIRHVGGNRHAVPAAFRDNITLEQHRHAADYTIAKTRLGLLSAWVDTALAAAFTFGGGLQWLALHSQQWFASPLLSGMALIVCMTVLSSLISLPLSLYGTFGVEVRFGFNKMTPRLYLLDQLRGIGISILIGLPLLAVVLWLMDIAGPAWWLWVWLVLCLVQLLGLVLYPILIAPLYNKFWPLADEALKARIDALLARTGFRSNGVYVMDGSRRSSHSNAYFTGFGAGKRIVFYDTLLEKLSHDEIEAVLAHELGHYKRRHIAKRIAVAFTLSLLFLALLGQLLHAPWFYAGLGVTAPSTAMALLLFMIAIPAFTFPLTPLSSRSSRKHEYEADDFAAGETRAADLQSALVKLYRDNGATLTPDPIHSAFYDSHPPAALRIQHLKGSQS
ncbi:M48 family metallopeptidase [Chromobacterium subtsugae]|uniref:M48 family metallopeptidase n=1 Tax=Chromobacterium subtsugae TaxID=251747 RepID=A0ABS7FFC0_9NEIS|nr:MULTISPECIES: M48 family metallopeptidase [Chromobacterium]KUM05257.1 peptidase M48 [Chromobacterium subtsugae]KZE87714.1 peptidase M48 [Chromobacterium sp. F49]MBW7568281.1 M48 family metallopeptidase [Chromobacterium subtsugae]MBW8288481.1 M48 family metallopeptidase [Chromobacterium subtsugae]OBU86746.1 peptidase M48 [Chromobacterium subtsugae]